MKTRLRTTLVLFSILPLILVSLLAHPVTAAPFSAPQNPGTSGLAAWWTLNETSGTRVDSLGISNLVEEGGVSYASGMISNAADFELDNAQRLSVPDNANLSTSDIDFTLGAWIKPESIGSAYSTVLSKGDISSAASLEYALLVRDNQAHFMISDGSKSGTITSSSPIVPGYWYFVLAWHDSTTDQIGIQVNDSTPDLAAWSYGSWDSNFPLSLGGDSLPDHFFDGLIDETFLYKRLLSADEREWLRNIGLGRTYTELLSVPTATITPTLSETVVSPTATVTTTPTATAQANTTPEPVTVIQTVIVTVPYIIIENGNTDDVAVSGGGEGSSGGSSTSGSFVAATPYAWQNVYGTGSSSCGGYSVNVRVYVDYNEDKMMSPAEGVTDLQIFFLDQSYSRLGSAYTKDGQATFCISPTLYGRTIYVDIPYLQKFNALQIPNEPKQDLEIWFAGDAPELPLFLP
jgi:hypothetical protein